jgi:hypothetical protein
VGFVVGKVALEQAFLRVLRFTLSVSCQRDSPFSYIIWRMSSRLSGGRSSETWSDPIDMNNNKQEWEAVLVYSTAVKTL